MRPGETILAYGYEAPASFFCGDVRGSFEHLVEAARETFTGGTIVTG
jgi:hypothetical protein